jgi:hypothetical protein
VSSGNHLVDRQGQVEFRILNRQIACLFEQHWPPFLTRLPGNLELLVASTALLYEIIYKT